jgi:hypothetical protein
VLEAVKRKRRRSEGAAAAGTAAAAPADGSERRKKKAKRVKAEAGVKPEQGAAVEHVDLTVKVSQAMKYALGMVQACECGVSAYVRVVTILDI